MKYFVQAIGGTGLCLLVERSFVPGVGRVTRTSWIEKRFATEFLSEGDARRAFDASGDGVWVNPRTGEKEYEVVPL